MNSKIKILIGILAIGVVLIGGFLFYHSLYSPLFLDCVGEMQELKEGQHCCFGLEPRILPVNGEPQPYCVPPEMEDSIKQAVTITTDRTGYSINDKINIKITNNLNSPILVVGPDCCFSLRSYGFNKSDNAWHDITPKWQCIFVKEELKPHKSVDVSYNLIYFSDLNYSRYRMEFTYSLREYDDLHELLEKGDKVYSNEFTIK